MLHENRNLLTSPIVTAGGFHTVRITPCPVILCGSLPHVPSLAALFRPPLTPVGDAALGTPCWFPRLAKWLSE